MQNILNRFSNLPLPAIFVGILLSALVAFVGFGADLSPAHAAPLSNVVIEETFAGKPTPAPLPSDPVPLGWTAWSG